MPAGPNRAVPILLLLATLAATAVAVWAALEMPRWQPSGGQSAPYTMGSAVLLLGGGLVLALGLVPAGGAAGAALAGPGHRLPARSLGALAGFAFAVLAAFGAVLLLEQVASSAVGPLLPALLPLPFATAALVAAVALRLPPDTAGAAGAAGTVGCVLAALVVLRLIGV